MDIRRVILYAALALVMYSLWTNWQVENPTQVLTSSVATTNLSTQDAMQPSYPKNEVESVVQSNDQKAENAAQLIQINTDVLNLAVDKQNGDIVEAKLINYPASVDEKNQPFILLKNQNNQRYVANSRLFVVDGQNMQNINVNFVSEKTNYQLQTTKNDLVVTLTGKSTDGLTVIKTFKFKRGSYLIDIDYNVLNEGATAWKGYLNTQLLWQLPKEDKSSMFHMGSYTGASYSSPGHHRYQKVNFKDMLKNNLELDATGGWVAMQQHYFLSAWIPAADSKNRFYTRATNNDYIIGAVSEPIIVAPTEKKSIGSKLYVGPELTDVLKLISPGLDLTADYGWLWFLSLLLLSFMKTIYHFVGNWGWSIVLVTVFIKIAFYRLSATSFKSMANMRQLQPKLQALRERYGDDKAKISQATMELYRQEKVNPLGGCLPILIQIPVFIALYWVLMESVELRQSPFIFWIHDLSSADPYHILPIFMGISMLVQQKLNPAPPDPMQAKVMMFLPIFFTAILWNSPSGLVLYWTVNNSLGILQQWYINRKYSNKKPAKTMVKLSK